MTPIDILVFTWPLYYQNVYQCWLEKHFPTNTSFLSLTEAVLVDEQRYLRTTIINTAQIRYTTVW